MQPVKNLFWFAAVTVAISAPYARAAEKEVIDTNWEGVRERLSGTEGKAFRIVTEDGRSFSASLVRVEAEGLVVGLNRSTSEWAVSGAEARIASTFVTALQQKGKRGHGRLIGTLIGTALAGVAVAVPGSSVEGKRYSRAYAAAVGGGLFIPIGYFIGRMADRPYPELRPHP